MDSHPRLNAAIETLNVVQEVSTVIIPAKAVFSSVGVLLTVIRDSKSNKQDYIDLGLSCADVCEVLNRGLNGRQLDELSQSVIGAIEQLTLTVSKIQRRVVKQGQRNLISRLISASDDKNMIATTRQDLNRILHIFNTELLMNILLDGQNGQGGRRQSTQASISCGEPPPPAPRSCFGREELVEKLVLHSENVEPTALVGAGGIGKTAIALSVLHDDRIRDRFGENRRFIRCDQFPASHAHFLARLSKVVGAGIENPENMTSLRPFFSSHKIFIVLDNAESVFDPQGTDAQKIYGSVNELCQFKTICVCITSRLTTIPAHCKRLEIPTLSMEAARDIFYSIYGDGERPGIIDPLLQRLDFHALSITLLATTASHNVWDYEELATEWDKQRAQVLRTDYNESLAATIELSLTSPTFCKLGPEARDLLAVVAFFPQGVDERNIDLFFPTISNRENIFRNFRVLSLTNRSNGFMTMLAPIRDYLCLQDPKSSLLLCAVKDCYLSRLSVDIDPNKPGFKEAQWIRSEDVNVEHLLNVFISNAADTDDVWDACAHFMDHLYWHKKRTTILGPKLESLPDDHPFKPRCLFELSTLFESVGRFAEQKQLLSHVLLLERERGNDSRVALTLWLLSNTNRLERQYEEGIRQATEALEIYERLGDTTNRAGCLIILSYLLHSDKQLDAAEDAAALAIKLFPEKGKEFEVCKSHRALGNIYRSKGEKEKAIHHFETALRIASSFNWNVQLFWVHDSLAELFLREGELADAQFHIEQAKSQAAEGSWFLGRAMKIQATIWARQNRFEDARSEVLGALEIFETLGVARRIIKECRDLLEEIEQAMKSQHTKLPTATVPSNDVV